MYEDYEYPRRRPGIENRRQRPSRVASRPDRVALWAVFMAVIAMLAAAASSADAAGGGVGDPSAAEGDCADARLGQRRLSLGDCGRDVKTLNWILASKPYANRTPLGKSFQRRTDRSVTKFQRRADLREDGVVNRRTTRALMRSMRRSIATWYGPGFWGNQTACGQRLTRRTVGVAHRRLPCGTRVTIRYKGRFLRTRVIDRGPYAHGATWDLTQRAAEKLNFTQTDTVRSAVTR